MPRTPGIQEDTKASPQPDAGSPRAPKPLKGPPPPTRALPREEVNALGEQMIGRLDAFLDELAEGHRKAMEETVRWLTGYGDLDREIQRSVDALNPLLQKWSIEICFLLRMRDTLRFNELKEGLPGIGSRTLSQRLKELEAQGIVER